MSREMCYTFGNTKAKGKLMEYDKVKKLVRNKSRMITFRINPDLLTLLDQAIKNDKQYANRNDLIEDCILKYLESKGKL